MSDVITFHKDGKTWARQGDISGLTSMSMVELRLKLMDLVDELDHHIDAYSAEGQLNYEIAGRMGRLASQAQAAGMLSAMWNDQQNRFYRQRVLIEELRSGQVSAHE